MTNSIASSGAIVAAIMLVVAQSASAQGAVRACKFEVRSRCASGEASVSFANGIPTKVAVDVSWCGQKGAPGYSCVVEYQRGDGRSTWTAGEGVVVKNTSPWNSDQPDEIKIVAGKHVSIDLEKAQSAGACGAGAELPRAIVISDGSDRCRVWLNAP